MVELTIHDPQFTLLTVTWSRDKPHFSLLRQSLAQSRFAHIPHHVVVHHEDLALFREFPDIILHSTADILPPKVEQRRREALVWQSRLGRRGTVVSGSLTRYTGWPRWVRYTGWHTQQLSKLAFAVRSPTETLVVLDSDVIVTPQAEAADFISPGKILCYEHWQPLSSLSHKVQHWQSTAHRLFGQRFPSGAQCDVYYDTPFVLHTSAVRDLLDWLAHHHDSHWWEVLLRLPPRQWSEFGIYKQYLRTRTSLPLEWRPADCMAYLFDVSDRRHLVEQVSQLLHQPNCHYVTIHSQSSGRQLWTAEAYRDTVSRCLSRTAAHP